MTTLISGLNRSRYNYQNMDSSKVWIENLSPLKPIIYIGLEENVVLGFVDNYRDKGYPKIKQYLSQKNVQLKQFNCKNNMNFIVGYGTIFQRIENTYTTLFIT